MLFIPMLFLMSMLSFALIQAPPGDYLTDYIAAQEAMGDFSARGDMESLKHQFGLDKPLYVQYLKWIRGVVTWNMGVSLEFQQPVTALLNERLLMTVVLIIFTIVFTWSMAVPIGIISAVKQYSIIDYAFTFLSYLGVGTPNFLLALVMMWFALSIFGLNVTGLFSVEYIDAPWSLGKVVDMLKHIWVPMLILGTDGTARLTRIVRANLLDELTKPYVETARAKGLPEWKVILKYPVRLGLNPFVSTAGLELANAFGGSLIVATVMSLPTIGPLLLRALLSQDMFMAGSLVLITTVLVQIGVLLSDIALAMMDPRIRIQG
jgi:peptide/nickel transport system permease protein